MRRQYSHILLDVLRRYSLPQRRLRPQHRPHQLRPSKQPRQEDRCVGALSSSVNRGLSQGSDDPGHLALVSGGRQDFIGAYRLDGWGYLWRIGGLNPNPDVAVPVAVAAMKYVFDHPPLPIAGGGLSYLWHVKVTAQ